MSFVAALQHSPDTAVLSCVLGILLIYIEFNRPGLVLPGAAGLLLILLGAAGLWRYSLSVLAVLCVLVAAAELLWGLHRRTSWHLGAAATVGIAVGCRYLVRSTEGPQVHLPTAALAGLIVGPGTYLLTAIARRARVNKGLD